jgi:hypothetical protein
VARRRDRMCHPKVAQSYISRVRILAAGSDMILVSDTFGQPFKTCSSSNLAERSGPPRETTL